jgi:hypothetical protein
MAVILLRQMPRTRTVSKQLQESWSILLRCTRKKTTGKVT